MTTICEYNDRLGSICVEGPNEFGGIRHFNLIAHNIGQSPKVLMTSTYKLACREFDRRVKIRAQDKTRRLNASIFTKTDGFADLPEHLGRKS